MITKLLGSGKHCLLEQLGLKGLNKICTRYYFRVENLGHLTWLASSNCLLIVCDTHFTGFFFFFFIP